MTAFRSLLRTMAAIGLFATAVPAAAAPACTATAPVTTQAGTYSPAAVNAGKVPQVAGSAGLACDSSLLVVFGSNSIKGSFSSANAMRLTKGAAAIAYTASADPAGTIPITQGASVEYMQNNVLNVAGLLGGSSAALPMYIKLPGGTLPPVGTYTDTITVNWTWKICRGISSLVCVGGYETQSTPVRSDITITLVVQPQDMTIAVTQATTWDPVNGTAQPRALPGAKGRTTFVVRNPDLVALDDGSIAILFKVPAKTSIALDGDGSASATTIGFSDGSPTSGTTLAYSPTNAADDVDFSSDDGATWTYAPTPGNRASEAAVTQVRFRPHGAMKPGSSFTLSIPYLVR